MVQRESESTVPLTQFLWNYRREIDGVNSSSRENAEST